MKKLTLNGLIKLAQASEDASDLRAHILANVEEYAALFDGISSARLSAAVTECPDDKLGPYTVQSCQVHGKRVKDKRKAGENQALDQLASVVGSRVLHEEYRTVLLETASLFAIAKGVDLVSISVDGEATDYCAKVLRGIGALDRDDAFAYVDKEGLHVRFNNRPTLGFNLRKYVPVFDKDGRAMTAAKSAVEAKRLSRRHIPIAARGQVAA